MSKEFFSVSLLTVFFLRLQGFYVSSSNVTESTFFFVFLFFLVLRRVEDNQMYERIQHAASRGSCSKWNSLIPFKLKPKTRNRSFLVQLFLRIAGVSYGG